LPESDLLVLIKAARAAGEVASQFDGPSAKLWHKPDEAGPVTEADLAVNDMLQEQLMQARPQYGWLSEETEDSSARQQASHVFIIDPIDGTRSFINGDKTWAHSLAIAEHGQITAAVVFLPMLNKLYAAARGQGASLNDAPLSASDCEDIFTAKVLTTQANIDPKHWNGPVPDLQRHHRPSLAYRLALVAEGQFDAMLTFRDSWEWDIAAGALIATEAGAAVTDKHGAALRFNSHEAQTKGVVSSGCKLHPQILSRLAYNS